MTSHRAAADPDDGQRFGRVICLRAQLAKLHLTLITQSFVHLFLFDLDLLISLGFSVICVDITSAQCARSDYLYSNL